ncbi:Sushi Domain-Containing Protein 6 [Manis pentadactyla]|nr:Sushi Domain-Containing Protein 6 [Manis pentadactyla]
MAPDTERMLHSIRAKRTLWAEPPENPRPAGRLDGAWVERTESRAGAGRSGLQDKPGLLICSNLTSEQGAATWTGVCEQAGLRACRGSEVVMVSQRHTVLIDGRFLQVWDHESHPKLVVHRNYLELKTRQVSTED